MRFHETIFDAAWLIEPKALADDRGLFARTFCAEEFAARGLESTISQINTNYSDAAGTIRGLHWQQWPHGEAKLVRCIAGEVFDVIVDVRVGSPTALQWQGFHLRADRRLHLYVPPGFAHGFLTLVDRTEVTYTSTSAYAPHAERGVRYDDLRLGIEWPIEVVEVSDKDRSWPDIDSQDLASGYADSERSTSV